ncbi:amidophosphoribosyltransferase [Sinimarinibacterium sp. NLF-5-8]|uniref:amidophosphoribosyltransferase n=1 Tax=Sinimarinibacterium sp. NLF-5-8 TaxID=2698684 RepID=UPI00137BFCC0|nr:amidophosphoribosyltransferase [Sinimarinibacterium sp. NLF-5-8]QHS09723.1 amidophosphoribosyltransferase [Sinimarinibacterium sp. NLF-5-8]
MCGIAGVVSQSHEVNSELFDALTMLQHRGQDAAGIITNDGHHLFLRKDNGLVRDVFNNDEHMTRLRGRMGVAHVRYPTAGSTTNAEAQPFYTNTPYGIALSHNGNLTNAEELKQELFLQDRRHLNTDSDSEVLLNIFAHQLLQRGVLRLTPEDVFAAVSGVHRRCRGAYACVAMITGYGIVGFRDPYGIRPAVYGVRETPKGPDYMIASESVALDALGYELLDDIAPGEAVLITLDGQLHKRQCAANPQYAPCIFEHVYLARPDSVIDDIYVYKARLRMGIKLAEKIMREWPDHDIDTVIPIPDTSRVAAAELAAKLGVHYREGFIKNRYIGRTFIMPGQALRKKSVRQKLNPVDIEFRGKNVLLVDDSIVRGTTSQEIVQMARDAGAKKVYFASAAPPVRYPNVYGIDMPTTSELVAHGRTEAELQTLLGTDRLIYQDLADLVDAVRQGNRAITRFDCSVFTGEYITQDVTAEYLNQLELFRTDSAREARSRAQTVIDLTNTA